MGGFPFDHGGTMGSPKNGWFSSGKIPIYKIRMRTIAWYPHDETESSQSGDVLT